MIGALILIMILFVITLPLLSMLKKRHRWLDVGFSRNIYWYHTLFAGIYYITVLYSPSDSVQYYLQTQVAYDSWFSAYDTGTVFIHFIGYPFVNYMSFSYEMMMVLFGWMGYWGFIFFYIFFKENIRFKHYWNGVDLISLIILLPNMHFWSASLGKGAIIFLGISLTFYALGKLNQRTISFIIGLIIIYHARPHIFLIVCAGIILGLLFGRQKIPVYQKLLVLSGSVLAFVFLYDKILAFASLDSENLLGSFDQLSSKRASDLSKAATGIDISNYPLVFKIFTFWYRPFFFDAPSLSGFLVSLENLFYLLLTFKLFQGGFFKFVLNGSALVKISIITFIGTTLALCGTLSNLGLIIRQKTMIMYFLVFVILAFMDYKKDIRLLRRKRLSMVTNNVGNKIKMPEAI